MGCVGGADLRGLGADCGLWLGLLWWEILPVSLESSYKSAPETTAGEPHCSLSGPSPTGRVALPGWIPKAPLPYNKSASSRQRNMAQMKEQSKASERELSEEEITNLSDGEFKALVIKMLTDLIELG